MAANSAKITENVESKLAAAILADPIGLHLDDVAIDDEMVVLTVTSIQVEALCPVCGQPSLRSHSSYERKPGDLALAGARVRLHLNVRRFFCANPACERKTFAERLPGVLKPFARHTNRLRDKLCGLGQALGGEAGARRAADLAMPVSPDTLLRLIRQSDLPSSTTPTVLGVDDFAWKKGQTYGTILVDLEQQQVVDLLPDRAAGSLAAWLLEHPGVRIISRDRGGIYAEGARRGAPDAEQVADRFHLLQNLRAALEPLLNREHAHLPKLAVSATKGQDPIAAADLAVPGPDSALPPATASVNAALAQEADSSTEVRDLAVAADTASPQPET